MHHLFIVSFNIIKHLLDECPPNMRKYYVSTRVSISSPVQKYRRKTWLFWIQVNLIGVLYVARSTLSIMHVISSIIAVMHICIIAVNAQLVIFDRHKNNIRPMRDNCCDNMWYKLDNVHYQTSSGEHF